MTRRVIRTEFGTGRPTALRPGMVTVSGSSRH